MAKPCIVFDTSVLFSYVWKPDRPYALLAALRSGNLITVTCPMAIAELREVAARYLPLERIEPFVSEFHRIATLVSDPPERFKLDSDPDDSLFFNLAIENTADFVVTYDEKHVLAIREAEHPQHGELRKLAPRLRIVTPTELALELARNRGN